MAQHDPQLKGEPCCSKQPRAKNEDSNKQKSNKRKKSAKKKTNWGSPTCFSNWSHHSLKKLS